jgi:small redox-active disulfide protein 2
MEIKVLGTGCAKCKKLERLTHKAIEEMGIGANVEKVEDIQKIMEYGIMRTPGLVIDNEVVLSGELPKMDKLKSIISQNLA